ncbi:MAG: hypothetical protein JXR96_27935 [Deltaproteobacteria bacterium]|nr:hypothetical protein [Deltaproteobacteria bacterium]
MNAMRWRAGLYCVAFLQLGLLLPACGWYASASNDADGGFEPDAAGDAADDGGFEPDAGDGALEDGDHRDGGQAGDCEPQQARAVGSCDRDLPGVKWDGTHCVRLGSGCECEGADCQVLYASVEACVSARRSCYDTSCEAAPVSDDPCILCTQTVYLGAFWDGLACRELWGCSCFGDGCGRAFDSVAECEAVHADCPASLCAATGGYWYFNTICGPCGSYHCGLPPDLECCGQGCDCGVGQSFVPDRGCQPDPSCTEQEACLATGGHWYPEQECICGFFCGLPGDCTACLDSCDCGPYRNFDRELGCVWDARCGTPSQESRCVDTGGNWHTDGSCGHYLCGLPNLMEPCVAPGCDCGIYANFDPQTGCTLDESCILREAGEDCIGSGWTSSCRPGLVCCISSGMPPAFSTCMQPCCQGEPGCSSDGCMPPPPGSRALRPKTRRGQ